MNNLPIIHAKNKAHFKPSPSDFRKYKNVRVQDIINDKTAPVPVIVEKLKSFKTPILDLI